MSKENLIFQKLFEKLRRSDLSIEIIEQLICSSVGATC